MPSGASGAAGTRSAGTTTVCAPRGARCPGGRPNALARRLAALAPRLPARGAPGCLLILPGILAEQAETVAAAYRRTGLPEPVIRLSGEWAALSWS